VNSTKATNRYCSLIRFISKQLLCQVQLQRNSDLVQKEKQIKEGKSSHKQNEHFLQDVSENIAGSENFRPQFGTETENFKRERERSQLRPSILEGIDRSWTSV
jgi:hypothetical protein